MTVKRPYAGVIAPGSMHEQRALEAARTIVLRFYRNNYAIFKKRWRRSRPRISYAALKRMPVKLINKFISRHFSNWRKFNTGFRDHFTRNVNRDRYKRLRYRIRNCYRRNLLTIGQAGFLWKTIFPLRKKTPVLNRANFQRALIGAVKKVPRFRMSSDARAKGVLKYSWSMLKILKVVPHIQQVFSQFRLSSSEQFVETAFKEFMKSGKLPSSPAKASRSSAKPARPAPKRKQTSISPRPRPRPMSKQARVQLALIAAVREVKAFARYSDKRIKGVLRYSWPMLKVLKVAPHILEVLHMYRVELKKVLADWK